MNVAPQPFIKVNTHQVHDTCGVLSGWAFRLFRRSSFIVPEFRHRWMDLKYAGNRTVFENEPGHGIYLALGMEGVKPRKE